MSIQSICELYEKGFFKVEPDSFYNPNVLIYQIQDSSMSQVFLDSKHNNKGVHILVDSEKNEEGNFKVQVGISGVSGEATLFDRLERMRSDAKDKVSSEPDKWDRAILIFDWKDDIENSLKGLGKFDEKEMQKLIDVVLNSEVFILEKFLQYKLNENAIMLNLDVKDRGMAYPEIQEADSHRYNYYLELVTNLLRMITKKYI